MPRNNKYKLRCVYVIHSLEILTPNHHQINSYMCLDLTITYVGRVFSGPGCSVSWAGDQETDSNSNATFHSMKKTGCLAVHTYLMIKYLELINLNGVAFEFYYPNTDPHKVNPYELNYTNIELPSYLSINMQLILMFFQPQHTNYISLIVAKSE